MRRFHRIASLLAVATALVAQGCAQSEPLAPPSAPSTAGGEAAVAQPAPLLGNAPSAQMAVGPRPAPVVPPPVSSTPSALAQSPQPAPAAAPVQPHAAPTYVTTPPPAPQREAYPTERSDQWVWAPGYWYWHGGQYVWIGGTWIPARRGHVYVSARWVHHGHGWAFVPGGWAVSTYDPIVYPVYPYDPFYYGDYWRHHHHHHHHHRHHGHAWHGGRSNDRQVVRPAGSLGVRRIDRARGSSRIRVRAKR